MTNPPDRLGRLEQALENERMVVADLRASVQVLKQTADSQNAAISELRLSISELRLSIVDTRGAVDALLQVAQIHQRDIEALGSAVQRLQNS